MLPRRGCSGDADEVAADGGAAGFGVGKGGRGTGRAQQVVADGGRREPAGVGRTEPAGRWAVACRSLRGALYTPERGSLNNSLSSQFRGTFRVDAATRAAHLRGGSRLRNSPREGMRRALARTRSMAPRGARGPPRQPRGRSDGHPPATGARAVTGKRGGWVPARGSAVRPPVPRGGTLTANDCGGSFEGMDWLSCPDRGDARHLYP